MIGQPIDRDLCLNCGTEHDNETIRDSPCSCENPNVVHQQKRDGCENIIGYVIDDDFCFPEKLYCPDCMDKAREK